MTGIFIFDFDLTITSEHSHNLLIRMIRAERLAANDHEKAWDYIKQIKPSANPKLWRQLFIDLIDEGNKVAIATFNSFEEIVHRYLKEIIQIPKEYFDKIFIVAWLPEQVLDNKNQHVKTILQHFNHQDREPVYLIDDSEYNCLAVRELGVKALLVDSVEEVPIYIKCIKELAKELKKS